MINYEAIAKAGGISKGTPIRTRLELAKKAWHQIDERESRKVAQSARKRARRAATQCVDCGRNYDLSHTPPQRWRCRACNGVRHGANIRGEQHPMFRKGDKDRKRGVGWKQLAESIRERDGHRCRRCDEPEREGLTLAVDHIRPWRSFTDKSLANHPDNLVALCTKCHGMKTMTVERAWLNGDVLGWNQFVASLHLPTVRLGPSPHHDPSPAARAGQ